MISKPFCRSDANALKEKLENLQKKILVGGENLLEKAEEQEKLLEASAQELEQRMTREEQLQRELDLKEVIFCCFRTLRLIWEVLF